MWLHSNMNDIFCEYICPVLLRQDSLLSSVMVQFHVHIPGLSLSLFRENVFRGWKKGFVGDSANRFEEDIYLISNEKRISIYSA